MERIKRKGILMIVVEVICVVLLGVFLYNLQVSLSTSEQTVGLDKKIESLRAAVKEAEQEEDESIASFDEMYQSKAKSLAYLFQNEIDEDPETMMTQYKDLLNVTNVLVVDKEGNIQAQAGSTEADFTKARYNQLKTVFETSQPSSAFEVKRGDSSLRYYAAKIDDDRMAVIEQEPSELNKILQDTTSWESTLGDVNMGLKGHAFAIDAKNYEVLYSPTKKYVGKDALELGVKAEDLEDKNQVWMEIDGNREYCGVAKVGDTYVVCAIPASQMKTSCNFTVGVVLAVVFLVLTLIIAYSIFLMQEQEKHPDQIAEHYKPFGKYHLNKKISTKILVISLVGILCVFLSSLYTQELFSLSNRSMSNANYLESLQQTNERYQKDVKFLRKQYNTRYLNKARFAAYVLEKKPELRTREEISKLTNILDVKYTSFFNESGTITATDSNYLGYTLSQDKNSQSYAFNKLLAGGDYLVQKAQKDDALGEYSQFIGVAIRNDEGVTQGFVQICVNPSQVEEAIKKLQVSSVLDGVQIGTDGFTFAIDKKTGKFSYYPDSDYIGQKASNYGIKKSQMKDDFSDFITINGKKYYANSLEGAHNYLYACVPASEIASNRLTIALITTAVSAVCLLIVGALLALRKDIESNEGQEDDHRQTIDVKMADGSTKKSVSIDKRWSYAAIHWSEKTPEQKMGTIFRILMSIYALVVCVAYFYEKHMPSNNSLFAYIVAGNWEKGLNIFSLTGCFFVICLVLALTIIIQKVLQLLMQISSTQGETIFRLLSNFVKYVSAIALLYYCFALLGVDTSTLLASAGLLGLMISLGAQKLVADVLAGLLIIFEGEFRVGDIVMIGDFRGTVVEIGIRTTKIEEGGGNVKVLNNSSITGVINMTKQFSFAACDFGIEYGESLERVEYILKQELPKIGKKLPAIVDGPFYKGVTSLGDNSVNIKIVAQCLEGDRIQLMRDLNREVKLLFDKYEISIPFPQVVINQPQEFKKATEWQKRQAEKFASDQKELTKDIKDGDH